MNRMRKSTFKSFGLLATSFVLIMFYQNCSKPYMSNGDLSSLTEQDVLQEKAMVVLTTKCSSCHNADLKSGGIDVMNVNELLSLGVVIPGEPSLSLIFNEIQGGQMPPSKSLGQDDIQAVYDWIADGFKTIDPIPLPTTPVPTVLEAKYASIYTKILQPKCLGCHNSGSANGVSFSTYTATMNTVQRTLPLSSSLYTSVATRRTMPKGTPGSLTAAENKAIFDWITAGAINN